MDRTIRIPTRISSNPILEAVAEYRFTSLMPDGAVFGVLYSSLKDLFRCEVKQLPILQLPEQVRMNDLNLKYQPCYRLEGKDFSIQIGPRVISFISQNNYPGWPVFFSQIKEFLTKIETTKAIKTIDRIGVRYINLFTDDIWGKTNLSILLGDNKFVAETLNVNATVVFENIKTTIRLTNNSTIQHAGVAKFGSLLDLDSFYEKPCTPSEALDKTIALHKEEKVVFFNLLKSDFVVTLDPKYED